MSALLALAWTIAVLVGVVVAYAGLCAAFVLFVRFPPGSRYAVLEDLAFVAVAPFLAAILGLSLLSIDGWR